MGEKIIVYNTEIELPEQPDISNIEDWGTDNRNEQYFRRKPLPDFFKSLAYDSDGDPVLTDEQEDFCKQELDKIRNGCWVMINGKATWIPGNYYYYLQYWTLENKKPPEYRDVSRRYAIFRWHWKKVYWCLGILRGKGRRTGATSEITSNITCEVTTNKNRRGGIISKTGKDARKIFLYRVQFGFRHLPFFLQPTLENDKDSKTEFVFNIPINKTKKGKATSVIDDVQGINSMMDYQAPSLNVYDQERLTDLLLDEGGKLEPDIPFSELLSIISETLVEGGEKVGFAEMPSTVNKWAKGGEEFKKGWDGATWVKSDGEDGDDDEESPETANKFVRYYCPSYDGLPGFIGKFGESIIEAPTSEQEEFLIAKFGYEKYNGRYKFGAKQFLLNRRAKLSGASLEEEIRKYSFDEVEMFMSANEDCIHDSIKLNAQIQYLKDNPIRKREVIFYRDILTRKVKWRDAEDKEKDFCWKVLPTFCLNNTQDNFVIENGYYKVSKAHEGVIGVDGISNSQGGKTYGSKASAWVFLKYKITDPENTGLFIAHLYGRPDEKGVLHEQVLLCAEYTGYIVYWEFVADAYYDYFKERNRLGFLASIPLNAIEPEKREKAKEKDRPRGFPTDGFAISAQNDASISYVKHYCHKIYWIELCEDYLRFTPNKRTPFDMTVSSQIALVGSLEPVIIPKKRTEPMIKVYRKTTQAV